MRYAYPNAPKSVSQRPRVIACVESNAIAGLRTAITAAPRTSIPSPKASAAIATLAERFYDPGNAASRGG